MKNKLHKTLKKFFKIQRKISKTQIKQIKITPISIRQTSRQFNYKFNNSKKMSLFLKNRLGPPKIKTNLLIMKYKSIGKQLIL